MTPLGSYPEPATIAFVILIGGLAGDMCSYTTEYAMFNWMKSIENHRLDTFMAILGNALFQIDK